MKKILCFVFVLASVAQAAKADVRFGGGAHAGLAFSSFPEPLNQYYGTGYGAGLNGNISIIEPLDIRVDLDYSRFSSDKAKLSNLFTVTDAAGNPLPFEVSGLDASMFSVTLNGVGKIPTGSAVRPYGLLGFGIHILNASNLKLMSNGQTLLDQSIGESTTRFGINVGAGTEFLAGPAKLFVELKYSLIFTESANTSNIPLTVGVAF